MVRHQRAVDGREDEVPNSTLYELRNMYVYYDVCQLDREMQAS